tara:strand:- start:3635 stop:4273 length:639 start_codon:yes stop_codon:yes gene_type:complete
MKQGVYTEFETERFLKKYVKVARHKLVKTWYECEKACRRIKYPLVLKIISKDALHKSDIHGVRLVKNRLELEEEFNSLTKIVKLRRLKFDGILVQEYVEGQYVLIGLKEDPVFGHAIALGMGGVYTEYMKDVTFRVCPISMKDADEMVQELKMKDLLFGVRGQKGVDVRLLKKTLVKISKIVSKYPEIKELDINPFVISSKGGKVVDARMVI